MKSGNILLRLRKTKAGILYSKNRECKTNAIIYLPVSYDIRCHMTGIYQVYSRYILYVVICRVYTRYIPLL